MTDLISLEELQALHQELLAVCDSRVDNLPILEQSLDALADRFKNPLKEPSKSNESRNAVMSGSFTQPTYPSRPNAHPR